MGKGGVIYKYTLRILVAGSFLPGAYEVRCDGVTDSGERSLCGVYFYQLKIHTKEATRKVIFMP
jgi:hypothetical protein